MRILFLLGISVFVISAAYAQDNVIRVINDDGSVQEVELTPARPKAVTRVPDVAPEAVRAQAPAPQPQAAPRQPRLPEIQTEMPEQLKAIVKPLPPKEPVTEMDVDIDMEADEVLSPVVDETVSWNQGRTGAVMIKPARKPAVPNSPAAPEYTSLTPAIPSGPISRERAMAIALEQAPPASSMMALPRVLDGRPVYVVKFRTEDGPLDIVVDQATGEILR